MLGRVVRKAVRRPRTWGFTAEESARAPSDSHKDQLCYPAKEQGGAEKEKYSEEKSRPGDSYQSTPHREDHPTRRSGIKVKDGARI